MSEAGCHGEMPVAVERGVVVSAAAAVMAVLLVADAPVEPAEAVLSSSCGDVGCLERQLISVTESSSALA